MADSNVKLLRHPSPTEAPAMGVSYQFPITSEGVSLVFQTHVDQTSGREDIDELLDRVAGAAERQKAKIELPEVRRHRTIAVKQLELAERDYVISRERFDAQAVGRNRREGGITSQQQSTLDNLKVSITRLREEVDRWDSEIAKREDVVHGGADANLP